MPFPALLSLVAIIVIICVSDCSQCNSTLVSGVQAGWNIIKKAPTLKREPSCNISKNMNCHFLMEPSTPDAFFWISALMSGLPFITSLSIPTSFTKRYCLLLVPLYSVWSFHSLKVRLYALFLLIRWTAALYPLIPSNRPISLAEYQWVLPLVRVNMVWALAYSSNSNLISQSLVLAYIYKMKLKPEPANHIVCLSADTTTRTCHHVSLGFLARPRLNQREVYS